MAVTVETSVLIERPRAEVWDYVKDLSSHAEWMTDAAAITFVTEQHSGVGTTFDCLTRIGPLSTTDRMTVTSWEDERKIGVRHSGMVTGEGAFRLTDSGANTMFAWREQLSFPLRFGGRLGEVVAKPLFTLMWQRNLRSLRHRLQQR